MSVATMCGKFGYNTFKYVMVFLHCDWLYFVLHGVILMYIYCNLIS